jgi:hypothetical protein
MEGMENDSGSRVAVPAQRAQGPLRETAAQVCGLGRARGLPCAGLTPSVRMAHSRASLPWKLTLDLM